MFLSSDLREKQCVEFHSTGTLERHRRPARRERQAPGTWWAGADTGLWGGEGLESPDEALLAA